METIKKRCTVVMLPTQEKTQVLRNTYCFTTAHGNPLRYGDIDNAIERGFEYNHLYVISDEKIKLGEWFIQYYYGDYSLVQCDNQNKSVVNTHQTENHKAFKIIATTNSKIKNTISATGYAGDRARTFYDEKSLLGISRDFQKKYCNKGGIDEVMVDYLVTRTFGDTPELDSIEPYYNKSNDIVITKVKDSWNFDEVYNLIRIAMQSKGHTPEYEVQQFVKENIK